MINYTSNGIKNTRARSVVKSFTVEDVRGELYVCPNNCTTKMVLLFVANANGNTTVSIEWYRASASDHYFITGGKNLLSGEFIQFSDSYIVLEPGDKIEITSTGNATPDIHAFCTVEETFIPVG
jgi:hypothetical protein